MDKFAVCVTKTDEVIIYVEADNVADAKELAEEFMNSSHADNLDWNPLDGYSYHTYGLDVEFSDLTDVEVITADLLR